MPYTGQPLTAPDAARWLLINRCVPVEALVQETSALARVLVERAPSTRRRYGVVVSQGRDLPLSAALRLDAGPDPYSCEDRVEGIAAFLEQRPPVWTGR